MIEKINRLRQSDPERYHYLLETLAKHLAQGEQYERLHSLFDNHDWLHARFEGSGYVYTSYIADLMLAWQDVAHQQVMNQVETRGRPVALANCVRYALIRTSINALSGNYVPELIFRAVEAGGWTITRALALVNTIPEPEQRVAAYAALLSSEKLQGQMRETALEIAVETALDLPEIRGVNFYTQAYALRVLAHELDMDLMKTTLDVHLAIGDTINCKRALEALFESLAQHGGLPSLEVAFEAALLFEDEADRSLLLSLLVEHLDGGLAARALDAALAIRDEPARSRVLSALASKLEGDLIATGLDAALEIRDEKARARILGILAGKLEGELAQKGLEAAVALNDEVARARVVRELVDRLPDSDRYHARITALMICDAAARAEAMTALAGKFDDDDRRYVLDKAWEAVQEIEDRDDRARAYVALADRLEGDERQTALDRGFDSALGIEYEPEVLNMIADRLDGEVRQVVLDEALKAALAVGPETARSKVLSGMAYNLYGNLLERALDAALALNDAAERFRVLNALAAAQPETSRRPIVEAAFEAALSISWAQERARALVQIADKLDGDLLEQAIEAVMYISSWKDCDRVMRCLAGRLDGDLLSDTLDRALVIRDIQYRTDALTTLVGRLEGQKRQQIVGRILDAAENSKSASYRARALLALADRLEGSERQYALEKGLDAACAIDTDLDQVQMLCAYAGRLEGEARHRALAMGLEAALAIDNEGLREEALRALAEHLEGDLLDRALDAAYAIEEGLARAGALAVLADRLDGDRRRQLLDIALDAAVIIEDEDYLWYVLEKGYYYFVMEGLIDKFEVAQLERGLDAVTAFDDAASCFPFLRALSDKLDGDARQAMLERALDTALSISIERIRARALSTLATRLDGELFERGLDAVRAFRSTHYRAELLTDFGEHMEDPVKQPVLKEALEAAKDIRSVDILARLAGHLEGEARQQAIECGLEAILTSEIIDGDIVVEDRGGNLGRLVAQMDNDLRVITLAALCSSLAEKERKEVLGVLAVEAFYAPPFNQSVAADIAHSIQEICWEWRWSS